MFVSNAINGSTVVVDMLSFLNFIIKRKKYYSLPIVFLFYAYGWLQKFFTNFIFFNVNRCQICGKKELDLYQMKDGGSGGCCKSCFENS